MNGLPPADTALVLSCAVALGAGLLIGIVRERRKGEGPERDFAGVRTFAMAALMGTVTQALNHTLLVVVAGLLLVALCGVHYARERSADPGITSELALFSTFLLGVHAVERPRFTAAAAVVVAALLFGRRALHRFSTELLTPVELRDALILAGAALIVLPLLQAPLAASVTSGAAASVPSEACSARRSRPCGVWLPAAPPDCPQKPCPSASPSVWFPGLSPGSS